MTCVNKVLLFQNLSKKLWQEEDYINAMSRGYYAIFNFIANRLNKRGKRNVLHKEYVIRFCHGNQDVVQMLDTWSLRREDADYPRNYNSQIEYKELFIEAYTMLHLWLQQQQSTLKKVLCSTDPNLDNNERR